MGIAVFIVVTILIGVLIYYYFPNENKILNFIKRHPENAAILCVRNKRIVASQNPRKKMILGSVFKIIIAIEYAEQCAIGKIDPDELILLSELKRFYIPRTDGGAHSGWLKSIKSKISQQRISIREIGKGMIRYSSNANSEWLLDKLGLDNVNQRILKLGLEEHSSLFYFVSALFVGKELFPSYKGKTLSEKLATLSREEYIKTAQDIHYKLKKDEYNTDGLELSLNVQKVWSDYLPASTVKDYVTIMTLINSRSYFDPDTQVFLDELMEFILEDSINRKWLKHTGKKGGATPFILTEVLYATDKKNQRTELAYFFEGLSLWEMLRLRLSINKFNLKILSRAKFRSRLKTEIGR